MSDWGLTAFYYDYEVPHRREYKCKVRGLVSRAYKYPGVPAMIMHAYSGVKYLLDRYKNEYGSDFDLVRNYGRLSDWDALNMSFDVFFDHEAIIPGLDKIESTIHKAGLPEYKERFDRALGNPLSKI